MSGGFFLPVAMGASADSLVLATAGASGHVMAMSAVPPDRVAAQPGYRDHLAQNLAPAHPARRLGTLAHVGDRVAELRQLVQLAQRAGRAKLVAAAGFGVGGLSLMGGAALVETVLQSPLLALSVLGTGVGVAGLARLQDISRSRAQLDNLARQRESQIPGSRQAVGAGPVLGNIVAPEDPKVRGALDRPVPDISTLPDWIRETLVLIPAGIYDMGSTEGSSDEKPVHSVVVSAFYMMNCPVTNEMYERIMGRASPSPANFSEPHQPVVNLSHGEAIELARKLTQVCEGKVNFRLPTEAEWEHGARGGRNQRYAIDPDATDISPNHANYGNTIGRTTDVRLYPANGFGLFDMSGNVWEWCEDWYDESYYDQLQRAGIAIDPRGPNNGQYRVVRGGSWNDDAARARSANRDGFTPGIRNDLIGVRFVVSSRT